MKALVFNINSDGYFYCKPLFTIVICENEKELEKHLIDNLREINATFNTSRDYIWEINNVIFNFIKAYLNGDVSYDDEDREDIWFVRDKGEFHWSFDLDYGNQSINIGVQDADFTVENGSCFINVKI